MSNTEAKQRELIGDLWAVYYGNPLYDDNGDQIADGQMQVLARALIAVLETIQLPEDCEVPK